MDSSNSHARRCGSGISALALVTLLAVASPVDAISIVRLGPEFQLADIGFDQSTREVIGIGSDADNPTLLRVDADTGAIQSEHVAGTGARTQLTGISPDGSRFVGTSGDGQYRHEHGVTWLSGAPESPIPIGSVNVTSPYSVPRAAWSGGVVGDSGSSDRLSESFRWTSDNEIEIVPGFFGSKSSFSDVSVDGSVVVGIAPGPVVWRDDQLEPLRQGFAGDRSVSAVSPNGRYIGGGGEKIYQPGSMVLEISIAPFSWVRDESTGDYSEVTVPLPENVIAGWLLDVSDTGYAVGWMRGPETCLACSSRLTGLIWNAEFETAVKLDGWLSERGITIPEDAYAHAIHEDPVTDRLILALRSSSGDMIVFAPLAIPEPSSGLLISIVAVSAHLRRIPTARRR